MKRLIISLLFFANCMYEEKANLDQIIAIAGDGIIMESELIEAKKTYLKNFEEANPNQPPPPDKFLEEQILENLIIQELQIQRASKAGVRISDQELSESMSLLAKNNNLNLIDFRKKIESQGDSYEKLRKAVKTEMILARVQRGLVGPKVFISEQELNNFINSVEGQGILVIEYKYDQILLKEEKKANEVYSLLKQDQKFMDIKAKYDESKNIEQDLIWRKIQNIPTLFTEVIKDMKLGEVRGPIKSGAGFHILMLKDKRGDTVKIEKQVLARHILIQTSEVRNENQAEKLINEIKDKLDEGEAFEILARLYSDDPGSKLNGGELGWSSTEKYDPEFKKVLDKLDLKKISNPFKSSFGWHVAEVLAKREKDISENLLKNKAYGILFERKFQEQLETTLQEMRSESFVEIKQRS